MITSIQNKRVAAAARLKKRAMREKDRRFLVEGAKTVAEAAAPPGHLEQVFCTPEWRARLPTALPPDVPVAIVSGDVMAHLTSTVTPQGIVGVAPFVDVTLETALEGASFVPVLVEVRDPGNAGTILRSADASGAGAVVFSTGSVDVYNPKTVRASAGSLFHLRVAREVPVEDAAAELRGRGFRIAAADAGGEASVHDVDLSRPTAVLLGNEARGLGERAARLADVTIRVPIAGPAESLNLAAAASVVLFEVARRRSSASGDAPGAAGGFASVVVGAAHDLRSPLTALRGFASTLESRWDRLEAEDRALMLQGIRSETARLELALAQLIDAGRLAAGSLDLSPAPVDLSEVARDVARSIAWPAPVEVRGEPVVLPVDRARARTIVAAMVEAAAWWGEEGPVRVRVAPPGQVVVERSGSALDPGRVEDVFLPRAPGTGGGKVGLFVARGLAEAHGGTLRAEGGRSIRFTVSLPSGGVGGA